MRIPKGMKISHNTYRIGRSSRRYSRYGYNNYFDPSYYLIGFGFLFIYIILMIKPYLLLLLLLIPLFKILKRPKKVHTPAPLKSRPSSLFIQRPSPKYCPSCNTAILPEGTFCQECGFNLSVVK